jgi:hypothetical protein
VLAAFEVGEDVPVLDDGYQLVREALEILVSETPSEDQYLDSWTKRSVDAELGMTGERHPLQLGSAVQKDLAWSQAMPRAGAGDANDLSWTGMSLRTRNSTVWEPAGKAMDEVHDFAGVRMLVVQIGWAPRLDTFVACADDLYPTFIALGTCIANVKEPDV